MAEGNTPPPSMELSNPTNVMRTRRIEARFAGPAEPSARRAADFRFDLLGLYYAEVGADWSTQGRGESDSLHHVNLVIDGDASVSHNRKTMRLEPGQAYFFPGDTPVARECHRGYETFFLKFRCEWLPGVDPLLDWPERHPICLGPWSRDEGSPRSTGPAPMPLNVLLRWQARLTLWLTNAIPDLDRVIADHISKNTCFMRTFELIEQQLSAELRIADLAQAQGSGLQSFSRAFARRLGIGPKAYLNRRLNQEAIRLVINTDLSMKEIALKLRFSDEYYFSRFFQKMNGQAPAHSRQNFIRLETRMHGQDGAEA